MPYIDQKARDFLSKELHHVLNLLTSYRSDPNLANLTKIALYRLAMGLHSMKTLGRLPYGKYCPFAFKNRNVSGSFVTELIEKSDRLAVKIMEADESREDYAGIFNYCCTAIIFEPLEAGIRYKKIPLINGVLRIVTKLLEETFYSGHDSHFDNVADSIIGVLSLDIPLEFVHRYVYGYERFKRNQNGDVDGYRRHTETLLKKYQS